MKMRYWTNKELKVLKKYYGVYTSAEISDLIDRSPKEIQRKAKSIGLKADRIKMLYRAIKYDVNEKFFQTPNILNCYWAGFIAADGCITKKNVLSINLAGKDKIILNRFVKDINFTGPIREYIRDKRSRVELSLSSDKIKNDLFYNFNIIPRKTWLLNQPNITGRNALAYIAGLIDGDGWIRFQEACGYKYLQLGICGHPNLITWVKQIFDKLVPAKRIANLYHSKKNKNFVQYQVYGQRAKAILTILDAIDVWKLPRKWNKIR